MSLTQELLVFQGGGGIEESLTIVVGEGLEIVERCGKFVGLNIYGNLMHFKEKLDPFRQRGRLARL